MNTLTALIIKGDRKAFDSLCRDRYASLISYARLFLDNVTSEDVVQDVLFSVWQNRSKLDPESNLQAYLIRSVYNRCMNVINHSRTAKSYEDFYRQRIDSMLASHLNPDSNPVMSKVFNTELASTLESAISQLPPRCAEIFRMRYIENMSGKEISAKLGISVSTVENQVNIALKRLRLTLGQF